MADVQCAKCGKFVADDAAVNGQYEGKEEKFCTPEHRLVYELRLWAKERGVPDEPDTGGENRAPGDTEGT